MTATCELSDKKWGIPSELELSNIRLRRGASCPRQLLMLATLGFCAAVLIVVVGDLWHWLSHRIEVLLVLGGIGCWRWSWFMLQSIRAMLYRYWTFPRLRRQAEQAVHERGPVPEVTILAVTYKEKPWITQAVFASVYREFSTLRGLARPPRLVLATGCDEDDLAAHRIHDECCAHYRGQAGEQWPPELVLLRGDTGKRPAIASALREVAAGNPHPDGVVMFMDGDTLLQAGLMQKVLPMFRLQPEVSAVTTDENGWVKGPRWFAEWISLRFGLRHRTMCSIALSGKLLCLTGRLSVFRAGVAVDPTFLKQIEHDTIQHWLWDTFEMLSGDDKSTWFWLAARERRMLYVPDAVTTTLEVVDGSALKRALANVRRWSGNSLRHSWRAFQLGPRKLGWFCWYSLLDQRLAIWTVLVGPLFGLLALLTGHYEVCAGFLLWVMFSRLAHASISWRHGRRFSAYYLPLQIISDWTIAITKVWVLFHPAKQNWLNRGARTLDSTRNNAGYRMKTATAHYLCGFACTAVVLAIGVVAGFVPILREAGLFINGSHSANEISLPPPAASAPAVLMFGMESPESSTEASSKPSPAQSSIAPQSVAAVSVPESQQP
jgi:glycosyltransferase Alg8